MRVTTRVPELLFPVETDSWLTVLRLGLGLQVHSMRSRSQLIGPICFRGLRAKSRKHCFLCKATSFRAWGGLLLWRHESTSPKRRCSFWHGLVCLFLVAPCFSEVAAASLPLQPGFYTCARRKAVGSSPTAWIIL